MESSFDFTTLPLHCRADPFVIHVGIEGLPELVLEPATDSGKDYPGKVPGGKLNKEPINQKSSGLSILKSDFLTLDAAIYGAIDELLIMMTEGLVEVGLLFFRGLELQPVKGPMIYRLMHDEAYD